MIDRLSPAVLLLALIPTLTMTGCNRSARAPASANELAQAVPISNVRTPLAGLITGGQPTAEQIDAAAQAGVHTVINLRAAGEPGFEWESAAVEKAGMRYLHIPVDGQAGLTRETIARIDQALDEAAPQGAVMLHCGSGNRAGAVLALRAAWLDNQPAEQALQLGIDGGLTKLEAPVRTLLSLPARQ